MFYVLKHPVTFSSSLPSRHNMNDRTPQNTGPTLAVRRLCVLFITSLS